jgi:hypothetical protein
LRAPDVAQARGFRREFHPAFRGQRDGTLNRPDPRHGSIRVVDLRAPSAPRRTAWCAVRTARPG